MILSNSDLSIEIVLGGAVATNQLKVYADWVDIPSSDFVSGSTRTTTNSTTPVELVPAITETNRREVKHISIYNVDTAAAIVIIRINDGTDVWEEIQITLEAEYSLYYEAGRGWYTIDPSGGTVQTTISTVISPTVTVTDDTTTNATEYITWVSATGSGLSLKVSTTKITFNPSTGLLTPRILGLPNESTPATPASGLKVWASITNGKENLNSVGSDGLPMRIGRDLVSTVRNMTGANLVAGDIVYVSGATGTAPHVAKAKADSMTTMQAVGVVIETITNTNYGRIQRFGRNEVGLDTSAFSVGDYVYVSETTAGALTNVRPAHPNLNQVVGIVIASHVSNGYVFFSFNDPQGYELGTNQNEFAIGSDTVGAKVLKYRNGFDLSLSANPTADRIVTIQDKTHTLAGIDDIFFSMEFNPANTSPADSTTLFYSMAQIAPGATDTNFDFKIGVACKLVGVVQTVSGNTIAGTNEDVGLYLRNVTQGTSTFIGNFKMNGSSTTMVESTFPSLSISIAATDYICFEFRTPAFAINPTIAFIRTSAQFKLV